MRILVYQHVPYEPPGLLASVAGERGVELEVRELWRCKRLPACREYAGLVVLGGPMSVYQPARHFPTYAAEQDSIRSFVDAGKPVHGICLGAEEIAHVYGGKVSAARANGREIGPVPVLLTPEGRADPLFRGFPRSRNGAMLVFQLHSDSFELPEGAERLATGLEVENQAFRYQSATGVLWRPELEASGVEQLFRSHPAAQGVDQAAVLRATARASRVMEHLGRKLLRNWLRTCE